MSKQPTKKQAATNKVKEKIAKANTYNSKMKSVRSSIVYIECKGGELSNSGRISRVTFSKSGKTIYRGGLKLQSLKGHGFKANYFNAETGLEYWVSNPKKDGCDSLYPEKISIDPDVAEEYWVEIRKQPENKNILWYKSPGKYGK